MRATNERADPVAGTPYLEHLRHTAGALDARSDAPAGALLNELAELLYYRGEYGVARLLHERALAIREQVCGPDHPDRAESLHNLATKCPFCGENQ